MIKLALLLALSTAAAAPAKEKKPVMEWKGQNGGPREPGHKLVTDAKGWEALWRVIGKDAPALNFKTHAAVAVFLGEKPTGGWTATFAEPKLEDGDLLVVYTVRSPKGFTTQAFTSPFIVRAFAKPAKGKVQVMEAKAE